MTSDIRPLTIIDKMLEKSLLGDLRFKRLPTLLTFTSHAFMGGGPPLEKAIFAKF